MTAPASSTPTAKDWRSALTCLALDSLAVRTSKLLTAADIPNVLIKGPATARLLYPGEPGRRPYTDVDMLVPVDRFVEAEAALREDGFQDLLTEVHDGEFPWHETAWRSPGPDGLAVDLHRGFAGVQDAAAFFDGIWATREEFQLGGSALWVPGPGATAFILALHASNPGRGRKPLADIYRAREVFPVTVWHEAAQLSRVCDADSAFRAGLDLLPNGYEFADELGIGGTIAADKWLAGRQHDRVSVNLAMALSESGFTAKAAHILRRVLPSPGFVRLWDLSARRGPGSLALAYGRRIIRAGVAAPRAVADVVTARRAVAKQGSKSTSHAGTLRSARRLTKQVDVGAIRVAAWALSAQRHCRNDLRHNNLSDVRLSPPPDVRAKDRRAVIRVLSAVRASCLERSVVLQRFDAAAGKPREVVIGVTAPGPGFRAHAWLLGEEQPDGEFMEITRRPVPPEWMS